jgi:GT2 family glycosyltransferase/glycosyltransferase involved in cell wall biosynthesis
VFEPEVRPGVVSVVIVNYHGADDTITCLEGFRSVDWPSERLELVVVDNSAGGADAERIRAAVPEATVVVSPTNSGFAGGCNLGVAHATGEHVAFLNNDARPDRGWISAAVAVLDADRTVASVASKVLDWEGTHVDYVDGALTWYGMGYKREVEKPDTGEWDTAKDVLFGTGAAMFVRASLFREVGGFDERFFMFYEDVDLGWRLNLLGYRVRYVPGSVAFHRHHATMKKYGQYRETYLLERNALLSMYKNLGDESLAKAFPAALALAVRRGLARAGTDTTALDLQRSPGGEAEETMVVDKMGLTGAFAVDYFIDQLPTLAPDRAALQQARRRSDVDLFPLFRQPMEPAYAVERYLTAHADLVRAFGIEEHFTSRRRIVVVTGEPVGAKMAGPAIRAWEIATVLAAEHEVRLVSLSAADRRSGEFEIVHSTGQEMHGHEKWADVIIFQGFLLELCPWLMDSTKVIVADVYDPIHLEQLEQGKDLGEAGRARSVSETTAALNRQLSRADYLMCASAKQRDFWLGQLAAVGRINPAVYDEDESLNSLIGIVPFGIPDVAPEQREHGIRGVVPGIGADDKVIFWGGGIYNWFDPLTLIEAVGALSERHPDVRLFFLGTQHPNPDVPAMRVLVRARALADELGLTGRVVFFNEGWVPYADRANYLLDADVGVSAHFEHVETAFSFRTRILDYLWAGLPIVATEGDTFGTLIEHHDIGITVPPRDARAMELALETMLFDAERIARTRENVRAFAQGYTWPRVLEPLARFCRSPRRAADLVDELGTAQGALRRVEPRKRLVLREDLALAKQYMADGGLGELRRRAVGRLGRLVGS